jgi:hypothetical protein
MSNAYGAGAPDGSAPDPNMLQRLWNYINPVGQANAAPAPAAQAPFQGPGTAQTGGPVNAAGQPQYAIDALKQALANGAGNTNQPPILPFLGGPGGPNSQGQPILPYTNPNTAALANAASIPTNGVNGGNIPIGGGPGNTMESPTGPQNIPIGGGPGNTMESPTGTPAAQPAVARGGNRRGGIGAGPNSRMRAQTPVPTAAQSPFVPLNYRPNANPGTGGGMLGGALASPRGQGGPPVATALDLSRIFGGGQPAAAVAPLPRTRINPGVIPPSATASVPVTTKAPWGMGPYQRGRAVGPFPQG